MTIDERFKNLHFSDHYEKHVATALFNAGISFVHESENKDQRLDFYIPFYSVYIEVKQFDSKRTTAQLELQSNVILLQGKMAINFFLIMMKQMKQ